MLTLTLKSDWLIQYQQRSSRNTSYLSKPAIQNQCRSEKGADQQDGRCGREWEHSVTHNHTALQQERLRIIISWPEWWADKKKTWSDVIKSFQWESKVSSSASWLRWSVQEVVRVWMWPLQIYCSSRACYTAGVLTGSICPSEQRS